MASQRPPWFRFMRPAAPAPSPPQPAPTRPPPPAIVRPTIPIRPPPPPTQTQVRPPSQPASALVPPVSPPRSPVTPPPQPAAAPPRSPVAPPAAPPRSLVTPPPPPAAAPPRSPVAPPAALPRSSVTPPAAAPPRSPVAPPVPQSSPPKAPPKSPVVPPVPQPSRPSSSRRSPVVSPISQPSPPKTPPMSPFVPPPHHTSPPPAPTTSPPSVQKNSPKTKTPPVANAAPIESPKTVKPMETTTIQSPKIKPLSHHPSPFTLPPPQIKADVDREPKFEQKSVLVQETIDKPTKIITPNAHNNGVAPNGKREPTTKDKGTNKKLSDTEEQGMRMITLAGENKGAVMQLSPSHKKLYSSGNPQSLQNKNTSETGEDGKSNNKDKTDRAMSMQSPTMSAILNSNVQGVNNSILYNMDCRQNDPGVHISLARKANGDRGRED
ncbi:hypothetical protein BUALT_Bualt01G0243200 [Buddleja alternifolia]|uniref:Vegetative cell wall protein gp1-like n=1 Tax=Buddleja alternifolia TaxID=168488 RepID=A0AAV6YAN0_9LAMI|nr:hypothetical protein BUALT_Bualt01G0243200 [Buddleja alternifolia]